MLIKNNKLLFIYDLANNHSGDVNKGLKIVEKIGACKEYPEFNHCFKFQYRQLDSLVHPDYKNRFDIKYVKRFSECKLEEDELLQIKKKIEDLGFLTAVTCFDNESVDIAEKHNFDIFKVASVSLTDWPLIERISEVDKPIILSTASSTLEEIDKVVEFMKHRDKKFALMHCRAEYPTKDENLELNQIDVIKERYIDIPVGFSTHEDPQANWKSRKNNTESVKLAIAKNIFAFECHIDIDVLNRNKYSRNDVEILSLLESAKKSLQICGIKNERYLKSEKEEKDLKQFRRGVFAKRDLRVGEKITKDDIYFAIPLLENSLSANDISKYKEYVVTQEIKKDEAVYKEKTNVQDNEVIVRKIYNDVKDFLIKSGVAIPKKFKMELSHHFGLKRFYESGAAIITFFNREYAKKLLIVLPGQFHEEHKHILKEETFDILFGGLELTLKDKEAIFLEEGNHYTVEREMYHSFYSKKGCILEEVSTTQFSNDSVYTNKKIMENKDRKTTITFSK
jgi:sialic acid synthase SpsE